MPVDRRVRHRLRRDEVLLAHRVRRHLEFSCASIDEPLDDIRRFRAPRAAIRIDRHAVGEDRPDPAVERRDFVQSRQHACAAIWNVGTEHRQIRAHVGEHIDVHRQELAVRIQRHARVGDVVAAVGVAEEVIGAVGDPLHILLQLPRSERGEEIFAIRKDLRAETAADVRRDDAHLFRRQAEDLAQHVTLAMSALAAECHREVVALGIVLGHHAARFHVVGDEALVDDLHFGDGMRLPEDRIHLGLVAERLVEQHVAREGRPDLRSPLLDCGADAGHRRLRLPVDGERFGGIARLFDRIGDDERHRVTDMAHFVLHQDRIIGHLERIVGEIEQARQMAEARDIVRGQDGCDAWHRLRGRRIDLEFCVRMRRAHDHRVQQLLRCMIAGVPAPAANEAVVFLADNALPDAEFHCHVGSDCNWGLAGRGNVRRFSRVANRLMERIWHLRTHSTNE